VNSHGLSGAKLILPGFLNLGLKNLSGYMSLTTGVLVDAPKTEYPWPNWMLRNFSNLLI
jgi:hypothetical protein